MCSRVVHTCRFAFLSCSPLNTRNAKLSDERLPIPVNGRSGDLPIASRKFFFSPCPAGELGTIPGRSPETRYETDHHKTNANRKGKGLDQMPALGYWDGITWLQLRSFFVSQPGGGRIRLNDLPFRNGRMRPNEAADQWVVTPPAVAPGSSLYVLSLIAQENTKD